MAKRNGTCTMDGTPVTTTTDTTPTPTPTPTPTSNTVLTGTVAHDGTPAIIDHAASKAMASDASTHVVTGIPYTGVLRTTGASYPFKGIRGSIYGLLRDGMTVADFVKAARTGYRGGIEDVRIYVRKGLAVVHDANGVQVYPPTAPAPTAPAPTAPAPTAPAPTV